MLLSEPQSKNNSFALRRYSRSHWTKGRAPPKCSYRCRLQLGLHGPRLTNDQVIGQIASSESPMRKTQALGSCLRDLRYLPFVAEGDGARTCTTTPLVQQAQGPDKLVPLPDKCSAPGTVWWPPEPRFVPCRDVAWGHWPMRARVVLDLMSHVASRLAAPGPGAQESTPPPDTSSLRTAHHRQKARIRLPPLVHLRGRHALC